MDHQDQQLDEQLAIYTDAVLAGKPDESGDLPEALSAEAATVQLLQAIIRPQEGVEPAFRHQLTKTLKAEWRQQPRRSAPALWKRYRVAMALAAACLLLIAGLWLAGVNTLNSTDTVGTAQGTMETLLVTLLFGAGVLTLLFLLLRRRS